MKNVSFDPLAGFAGVAMYSDEHYRELINQHKKRKIEDPVNINILKFYQTVKRLFFTFFLLFFRNIRN